MSPHRMSWVSKARVEVDARVVAALERAGLQRAADGIRRQSTGTPRIVAVAPPAAGAASFRLHSCDDRDQVARTLWRYRWWGFEWPTPALFAACVRNTSADIIDVGANTGVYSFLAASMRTGARIFAFEPYAPARGILYANLLLNRPLAGQITVVPMAASNRNGRADLYVPSADHGLVETSCSLDAASRESFASSLSVEVLTLDSYAATWSLRVGIIKVDAEGFDWAVLAGCQNVLTRDRPIVFFEQVPQGNAPAVDGVRQLCGYTAGRLFPHVLVIDGSVRRDVDCWQRVLVPSERMEEVCGLAAHIVEIRYANRESRSRSTVP